MLPAIHTQRQRAFFPAATQDFDAGVERDAVADDVAQRFLAARKDARDDGGLVRGPFAQWLEAAAQDGAVRRRDGVAVRIEARFVHTSGDRLDEAIRDGVLQPLGLGVHLRQLVAQLFHEEELDEAVTPQNHESLGFATGRQPKAAPFAPGDEAGFFQTLRHVGYGRRGDLQDFSHRAGRNQLAAPLQREQRLEKVLHRLGLHQSAATSHARSASLLPRPA